ncbi:MAG: dihydroorotase [Prevotellaceae bacterium]|nr:dihydroorotase [Prevotellaceae bacterium]
MNILIHGGNVVNEGEIFKGAVLIEDGQIAHIEKGTAAPRGIYDKEVDATGCFVLPGVIDEHVHFREPGLTAKADMESESRAAAFGGVTTFFDMPNTVPQTTQLEVLEQKFQLARQKSHVNYSFFLGATAGNVALFQQVDHHRIPGFKLFMGASTGNMLVDRTEALQAIFAEAARLHMPVMTHCEDSHIISRNMAACKATYGDDPAVIYHPAIRSEEACVSSTACAVALAKEYGTQLHVSHLSTAAELQFFGCYEHITAEAVVAHLLFTDADYESLGTRIKCNPAVKTAVDRAALRTSLTDGRIYTVATDHAPHLLADKQGGCAKAASGMPMLQFSLPAMLELVDEGVLSLPQLVTLMAHHPATLFGVRKRGFLREGYQADVVVVQPNSQWQVTKECIQSKCGWSPLEGHTFAWRIRHTFCNGQHIYNDGVFDDSSRGEEVAFR